MGGWLHFYEGLSFLWVKYVCLFCVLPTSFSIEQSRRCAVHTSGEVVLIPGVVEIFYEVVNEYLQVFDMLLAKYSICFLSSIQCVACQVFVDWFGDANDWAGDVNDCTKEANGGIGGTNGGCL